jgi:hypothetical protein
MSVTSPALTTAGRAFPPPRPIRTTLYDLAAAINAVVSPDEEHVATAVMVHLLQTHRVTCLGELAGVRVVCDTTPSCRRVSEDILSF